MIKVNLLKDQTARTKDPIITAPQMSRIGVIYIAAVLVTFGLMGFWWVHSNSEIKKAEIEKNKLTIQKSSMNALQKQFAELEQKKRDRQGKISVIEKLQESQKGPVKLLNAVIQAVPQNRAIWLSSLEQTNNGVKVLGQTQNPEILPDFMNNLSESNIFASVDIELVERREDISNFSITCTGK